MKEFSAQTGGRYTYVDDIINLQELALAFNSIFDGCDAFIISGCEVSGSKISDGYVYLNGKIRYFSGATEISTWPQYIYEVNSTETMLYASGDSKVGRNIWGCANASSVPTATTPLTNTVPKNLEIPSTGGLRIKDALYGRYALLLNAKSGSQIVNGAVTFGGQTNISKALYALGGVNVVNTGDTIGRMYNNNGQLVVESQIGSSGTVRKITFDDTDNIAFYVGGTRIARITSGGIFSDNKIQGTGVYGGNIYISGDHLYNRGTANIGTLYINYEGYNGGTTYYRSTIIGNGREQILARFNGPSNCVNIYASLILESADSKGLLLQTKLPKTNLGLTKIINWQDSNKEQMAYIGYNSSSNNIFEIKNLLADVSIVGSSAVDLGPAIKEGGTLLSAKYATLDYVNTELAKKSNTASAYTKTESDTIFATKTGGLSQFINTNSSASQLRTQIGAIAKDDISNTYASLTSYLADMAKDEDSKNKICENIGAARTGSFQEVLSDTEWVSISNTSLYARQIGNIVCIQGTITPLGGDSLFTLPNQIDPPTYAVGYSHLSNFGWGCEISGGSRVCKLTYANNILGVGSTAFSITYMI